MQLNVGVRSPLMHDSSPRITRPVVEQPHITPEVLLYGFLTPDTNGQTTTRGAVTQELSRLVTMVTYSYPHGPCVCDDGCSAPRFPPDLRSMQELLSYGGKLKSGVLAPEETEWSE